MNYCRDRAYLICCGVRCNLRLHRHDKILIMYILGLIKEMGLYVLSIETIALLPFSGVVGGYTLREQIKPIEYCKSKYTIKYFTIPNRHDRNAYI